MFSISLLPILLGIYVLICVFSVEHADGKPQHWPLLFTVAILLANYWKDWFTIPELSTIQWIVGTFSYFFLGLVWSIYKWYVFNVRRAEERRTEKFLKPSIPNVNRYKSEIAAWIIWWPFSILNSIFSTIIFDFSAWVVGVFGGMYQSITKRVFSDLYEPATNQDDDSV